MPVGGKAHAHRLHQPPTGTQQGAGSPFLALNSARQLGPPWSAAALLGDGPPVAAAAEAAWAEVRTRSARRAVSALEFFFQHRSH